MTSEQWRRIKQIAGEAWERPAAERAAIVAAMCADDEALGRHVASLLESMDAATDRFETPALTVAGALDALDAATDAQPTLVGTRIGPYRLVRELGQGGMGTVYLAERADGEFDQQVAIKFVTAGMSTEALVRRFRDERRILATLDHPNIARLFDGGTSDDGRPFVVMEYVAGEPIAQFCQVHDLGVRARLELLVRVCAAVQYAHQRLVIHRDVKSSNILVMADGTPKLLDFGIATLVEPGLAPAARTSLRAHTPETASPEQLRGDPITVSVDIYALGLLAFEMLAGAGPYAGRSANEAELIHAICHWVPPPPSAVVGPAGVKGGKIDRDLDVIVMKALRKEPERRYQSVEQLSADLRRYLDGRPVLAAPDSRRYRTAKFVGRHRAAVAAVSVATFAILSGAGAAAWQARVARQERARAEQRFEDLRRLTDSFLFEFHDAIADLPGALKARQLVVKRAAEYLDRLATEAQDDLVLQREVATANERLATILGGGGVSSLGDLQGAEARYLRALSIRETLARRPRAASEDVRALAGLRVQFSRFFATTGDLVRAEDEASEAVRLLAGMPDRIADRRVGELATAYHQLGYVQARRDEAAAALRSFEQAVTRAKAEVRVRPDDTNGLARLSRIETDYADQLSSAGRYADCIGALREAEAGLEQLLRSDPLNVRHRLNFVRLLNVEGDALHAVGNDAGAVRSFTRSVGIAEALQATGRDDHGNNTAALISRHRLGLALVRTGQGAAGERRLREAILDGESITKAQPEDGWSMNELATTRLDLGAALLERQPGSAEGCREIGEGLRLWQLLASHANLPAESTRQRARFEHLSEECRRRSAP